MTLCWLLSVVFVAALFWSSHEHMSNKDLIDTLKTFGVDDSGQEKPKKSEMTKQEIYGPGLSEAEKPQPKPKSDDETSKKARSSYPHIYGPDYQGPPGAPYEQTPYEVSDGPKTEKPYQYSPYGLKTEKPYQFNPDFQKAFPVNGPPQPFLTDFSKFQK